MKILLGIKKYEKNHDEHIDYDSFIFEKMGNQKLGRKL
jgi:hypothetical protein